MQNLLLIDGNSIICRYFFGLPEKKSPDGLNVNGVFGFSKFLFNLIKEKKNFHIIVCFDKATNNFRKEIYKTYKQNRPPFNENFFQQMRLCEELCNSFNIYTDDNLRYEADDLIATYCKVYKNYFNIIVYSNDKDLLQLVNEKITIYNVSKKKYFFPETVYEELKIRPNQIAEFLAISGDMSDNISGIFSIGPKTTIKLLNKYDNLENIILANENSKIDFKPAREFLKITKLIENVPIKHENLINNNCYFLPKEKINNYLNRYGFYELLKLI